MNKQEKLKEAQERLVKLKASQEKISNEIEKFKNEIEELKTEIENEKSKCWEPVTGDVVYQWLVGAGCGIEVCYDEDKMNHKRLYEAGELFPTKELCKEHHKERIYKERWKRLSVESGEDENPWDGSNGHWCVAYSVENECLRICSIYYTKDNNVYFSSCEAAENAIKEIGEDNVKRYVLGIKE